MQTLELRHSSDQPTTTTVVILAVTDRGLIQPRAPKGERSWTSGLSHHERRRFWHLNIHVDRIPSLYNVCSLLRPGHTHPVLSLFLCGPHGPEYLFWGGDKVSPLSPRHVNRVDKLERPRAVSKVATRDSETVLDVGGNWQSTYAHSQGLCGVVCTYISLMAGGGAL